MGQYPPFVPKRLPSFNAVQELAELNALAQKAGFIDVRHAIDAAKIAKSKRLVPYPAAFRWPNGRGKYNYIGPDDTVVAELIPLMEPMYLADSVNP